MDTTVKTGVDDLLDLLEHNPKVALSDVAKKLNVSLDIVQAWVDFLVEERIVGIEYKFTTPYVYMNKSVEKVDKEPEPSSINIQFFKDRFWEKARKNNIPDVKIASLWKNHLAEELELKKKYFFFEAQQRKIMNVDSLWEDFCDTVLSS